MSLRTVTAYTGTHNGGRWGKRAPAGCDCSVVGSAGSSPVWRPLPRPRASTTPHVIAGERKRVTVLFCDLVDATPQAERLGPEGMHRLLQQFFDLALHEV
jgi:class 3 adenylate cyclase